MAVLESPIKNRLRELDALRGIAALSVMVFHYTYVLPKFVSLPPSRVQFIHGSLGVDLFFMISGFVILLTLDRTRRVSDFVVSRFARLYPAFWVCMFLTAVVGTLAPLSGQSYTFLQVLVNATMIPAFFKVQEIDGVYWSLAYELGFYFSMCTLFAFNLLRQIDGFALAWLMLSALFVWHPEILPHPLHYILVINKFTHLFVFGISLYQLRSHRPTILRVALAAVAVLFAFIRLPLPSAMILAALMLIFSLAVFGRLGFLTRQPVLWLGAISYPLYLIHQMIGYRLIDGLIHLGLPRVVAIVGTGSIVIAVAGAVHALVERPAQRFLKAWWRGRAPLVEGAANSSSLD